MIVPSLWFCGALLLISAGLAFGEGTYQRTKDGNVTVWNDDPKPGDAATWFGDRDKENYATGVGTLTWRTAKGNVYARYHGNMVRGKFDGAVNVHSKGKTGHASFADGKRTSRWAAGPAPERGAIATAKVSAPGGPDTALTAKAVASGVSGTQGKKANVERRMENTPAEGPSTEDRGQTAEGGSQKSETAANPSVSGSNVRGQKLVASVDRPKTENAERSTPKALANGMLNAQRPTSASATRTDDSKPEVTDFLGPPPALRTEAVVDVPSTRNEPEIASSPSAAQLTPQEAIALADAEARAQGYDLNKFQRPKADYSKVKGRWSLLYDSKKSDGTGDTPRHFNVTVDDETKNVETQK